MKKNLKLLPLILPILMLVSCGKFRDGTSVWGGGLWIIPLLPGLGAAICFLCAIIASNSNSTQQINSGTSQVGTKNNTGNVKFTSHWGFKWGIVLLLVTIGIIIWVNRDK